MADSFHYNNAFCRNIGWVTQDEQDSLRSKRIAIAGMGGVGGIHLITLARLGIGAFNVADMDDFEVGNFNRQAGAAMSTIGQPKVSVMAQVAADINPEADIRQFTSGVDENNLDEFLEGVDLYVDGLDFFALSARRIVFDACARKGIPAITVAPLGMGAAFVGFLPGKMTFEQYFQLEGHPEKEQLLRFGLGLSPSMLQLSYIADVGRIDFHSQKVPSMGVSCQLCAGVAGTNAVKILLKRGKVYNAPWVLHFDPYTNQLRKTWRPWGSSNPIQRLGLMIARKRIGL